MERRELEYCRSRGVKDVVEVKIGYGAVTLALAKDQGPLALTRRQLYLALAKEIPDPGCEGCDRFVRNPYKTWKAIDPALPDRPIEVLGPPEGSGTREVFSDLVMEGGCAEHPAIAALKDRDAARYDQLCRTVRADGVYAREDPDKLVDKLSGRPHALALVAYNQFLGHIKDLAAVSIEGVAPSTESVTSGKYPIGRTLFFYVKADRVGKVPGLAQYLAEFTDDKAWGDKGYLAAKGLIPMPAAERKVVAVETKALKRVSL
jgi:phosphate transport system substrate-binding protein